VKQDNVHIAKGEERGASEKDTLCGRGGDKHGRHGGRLALPSTHGDIFVATQVTKMNEDLLNRTKGNRVIKASSPPFNRKGGGNLPAGSEEVDAPAFGVRVSDAIMEIMSIDGMCRLSAALQIRIPVPQLNQVVQSKIRGATGFFKRDMQDLFTESWLSANANAFARLEAFASEVEKLKPDSPCAVSMQAWNDFVGKFVIEGWQSRLHVDEVLLNFGFREEALIELRTKLATMSSEDDCKLKNRIHRNLAWFSKALGCYGLAGSLSDVVNLAFAMTGAPTHRRHISEDEVISVLTQFKKELTKLTSEPSGLWLPSIYVHDCEMDDMLAWLILAYAHHQRGSKLEVYAQLPSGNPDQKQFLDQFERRLLDHCTHVYRDPDAMNYDAIALYSASKL